MPSLVHVTRDARSTRRAHAAETREGGGGSTTGGAGGRMCAARDLLGLVAVKGPRPRAPAARPRLASPPARRRADAPRAGALIINEAWAPGWHATIDGLEAPIYRANFLFQGLPHSPLTASCY